MAVPLQPRHNKIYLRAFPGATKVLNSVYHGNLRADAARLGLGVLAGAGQAARPEKRMYKTSIAGFPKSEQWMDGPCLGNFHPALLGKPQQLFKPPSLSSPQNGPLHKNPFLFQRVVVGPARIDVEGFVPGVQHGADMEETQEAIGTQFAENVPLPLNIPLSRLQPLGFQIIMTFLLPFFLISHPFP